MEDKHCKTCKWFDHDMFKQGYVDVDDIGQCLWPASRLPASLKMANREREAVLPLDGQDCGAWEAK